MTIRNAQALIFALLLGTAPAFIGCAGDSGGHGIDRSAQEDAYQERERKRAEAAAEQERVARERAQRALEAERNAARRDEARKEAEHQKDMERIYRGGNNFTPRDEGGSRGNRNRAIDERIYFVDEISGSLRPSDDRFATRLKTLEAEIQTLCEMRGEHGTRAVSRVQQICRQHGARAQEPRPAWPAEEDFLREGR